MKRALWVLGLSLPLLATAASTESFVLPRVDGVLPVAPPARRIDRLAFSGNAAISSADLRAAAAAWLGRELDEADIEALRQHLTRVYIERGYVNSGVLLVAPQTEPGVLQLRVVEGRLTQLQLRGLRGLSPRYVKVRLGENLEGEVLNMEPLRERFQLLLADPLFKRVQARLLPGDSLGEAVLDVEVERNRPWNLTAYANNYRPVSVGEAAVGLRGQVSNVSGQGDVLDVNLQFPASGHGGSQSGQQSLNWQLPLHRIRLPNTKLLLGFEHADSAIVEEPVAELDIHSRSIGLDFGLASTLVETLSRRHVLGMQVQLRRQYSTLMGMPYSFTAGVPDGRVRNQQIRSWHEGHWRSEHQALVVRSTVVLGRANTQLEAPVPGLEAPAAPTYLYFNLQSQWLRRLNDDGLSLNLRLLAQISRDRLLSLDGLSAGGVRSVRGFRENQLLRDEGAVLDLGLEWPLKFERFEGLRLSLQPFYDIARLHNRNQDWVQISSVGLALKAIWGAAQLDLSLAKRLQGESSKRDGNLQDQGVSVEFSWTF